MPRKLTLLGGTFTPNRGGFVKLGGPQLDALWLAGRIAAGTFADRGLRVTAAPGRDTAIAIDVDAARMPIRQSYRLAIAETGVRITAADPAGAFYAAQTLRQIARHGSPLPCIRIEDWPDLPARGVMIDISRDKVYSMDALYRLVDLLASMKVNQLQLYTEHTFAYREHRDVWEDASPMTPEDVIALDRFCRERFIELVPNQNSFGHMERWLKHERYRPLADAPDGCETEWGWFDAFSISPVDPGSIELLRGLYDDLLPNFTSRQFNVGCDETIDLGVVRSKAACEERGKGRVYLDFLTQIHALVRAHGRTMQFWGDIILHHPELIPELPDGVIALEWGYEADHPFDTDCAKFADAGVPFYVCPGTTTWNTLIGRTDNAIGNLRNAAEAGLRHGAVGYLNTNWGDGGNWEHIPVSYLGFACGAAVSWCHEANRELDFPRALDLHVFEDSAAVLGRVAFELGNVYQSAGKLESNASVLCSLLRAWGRPLGERFDGITVASLRRTLDAIKGLVAEMSHARLPQSDGGFTTAALRNNAALAAHSCKLGVARLQRSGATAGELPANTRRTLAGDLEPILAEFRRIWLAHARPGGLEDSIKRLDALLAAYRS
jgi:hypothetical protein